MQSSAQLKYAATNLASLDVLSKRSASVKKGDSPTTRKDFEIKAHGLTLDIPAR